MNLTGKCKEAFEKWSTNNGDLYSFHIMGVYKGAFYELPKSMQYGVLVDFFDSTGMDIEIAVTPTFKEYYCMINDDADEPDMFKTRQEARTKAILKANEIYNTLEK